MIARIISISEPPILCPLILKHLKKQRMMNRWGKVIDNNYKLFAYMRKKLSVADAGLLPDFIREHQ